ncbi:sensor histidine kinase [Anaerosporobacter sp.]
MIVDVLIDWLPSLIENFTILYFMAFCLKFKKSFPRVMQGVILCVLTIVLCLLSNFTTQVSEYETILMVIAIIVCVGFGVICLEGTLINSVFTSLIPFVLIVVINSVTLYVVSVFTNTAMNLLVNSDNITVLMLVIVTKGILILAVSLIARLSPKSNFVFKKNEIICILLIFVSTFLISVYIFNNQIKIEDKYKSNNIYFILAIIGLIVINILTYVSYIKIEKDNSEKIKYELVKMQLEQQKQSYGEFEKKNLEIRKIRHDMRNYMDACLALIKSSEYDKAQEYLNNICTRVIEPINYAIVTDSSLINAFLNNKLHECNSYGIKLDYKILSGFDGFDELDICVLLGNLWNNAVEATKNLDTEKLIYFEVLSSRNYLIIILRNNIKESILKSNPNFKTTKLDKANHGLGIISVREIVEKYGGIMEISENDKNIEFQISLKRRRNIK